MRLKISVYIYAFIIFFSANPAGAQIATWNDPTPKDDVRRSGPDDYGYQDFRLGQLGVLLPSYGREPLYLAFRSLLLKQPVLEKQKTDTKTSYEPFDPPRGGIPIWLKQRDTVTDKPLPHELNQDRSFDGQAYGKYLNCGNDAFNLAAVTLKTLSEDAKTSKASLQEWVAAQDMVFDLCGDPDSTSSARPIPAELSAATPLLLRQLRQYQIAAADFYAGQYDEALHRFDAIASGKTHPMRIWASHASLRTLLRSASLDRSFVTRVSQIRNSTDSDSSKHDAYAAAVIENQHKMAQFYEQIAARVKTILSDDTLKTIHESAQKLLKQAAQMIVPDQVYSKLSDALGRFDTDAAVSGDLYQWSSFGDRLFDNGGYSDLFADLRSKLEYFDWIATIQGCTDNPLSPHFTGRCQQESQHALQKWQATQNTTWLVAALMTAQQLTPQLEPALTMAQQVKAESPEYLTVRYYMAKLLYKAGRRDDAIAMIDPVLVGPSKAISRSILYKATSANYLFRQERLAVEKNEPLPGLREYQPSDMEIRIFYATYPELFSARRIYTYRVLSIETSSDSLTEIKNILAKPNEFDAVTAWAKKKNLHTTAYEGTKAAEQIPMNGLPRLAKMQDGQILLNTIPSGFEILELRSSKLAPIDEIAAAPVIRTFLINSRRKAAGKYN